jgi:hypothetical protein
MTFCRKSVLAAAAIILRWMKIWQNVLTVAWANTNMADIKA